MAGKSVAAIVLAIEGVLLYAAWQPDSMPGQVLIGPTLIGPRVPRLRQFVSGAMGVVMVAIGSIAFIAIQILVRGCDGC